MSARPKDRRNSGLSWLKGIGAFVLLLAMPTYSYLDQAGSRESGSAGLSFQERGSGESRRLAAPEQSSWNGAPRPPHEGLQRELPSSLQIAGQADGFSRRSAAGLLPAESRRVPAGVPSADTSARFVRSSTGRAIPSSLMRNGAGNAVLTDLAAVESETMGSMVARSSSERTLANPFLAALEERGSGLEDAQDPAGPAAAAGEPDQPASSVAEGADPAGGDSSEPDDAAPVGDQKERRDDPPPEDSPPQDPADGSDSNSDSGGDTPPDDSSSGGSQDPSEPDSDPTTPPAAQYNFLVVPPPISTDGGQRVFRARRDGADEDLFLLEDGSSYLFPQFQVNQSAGLAENEKLLTSDVNFDGLLDLVVATNHPAGCTLEVYLRRSSSVGGRYELPFGVSLPDLTVGSFALLDFDLDNALDVAVLFQDHSQLFVFRLDLTEKALRLLEERQLPFKPALVIDWQIIHTGGWPERLLYVFDESFSQAAAASSFEPEQIQIVSQAPPFRTVRVNWPNRPREAEVLVFESEDRIILVEEGRFGYSLQALFDTTFFLPEVVVGDFLGNGTRQLLADLP